MKFSCALRLPPPPPGVSYRGLYNPRHVPRAYPGGYERAPVVPRMRACGERLDRWGEVVSRPLYRCCCASSIRLQSWGLWPAPGRGARWIAPDSSAGASVGQTVYQRRGLIYPRGIAVIPTAHCIKADPFVPPGRLHRDGARV